MDLTHYSHKENEMKTDGGVMTNETKKYAETYGGMAGAVLPLIIMMGTMIFMVAFGMRSTKNFWSAGYFAVLAGFLVYKDKKAFQKALIDGVRDNIFAFMIACFLFAGVMSKILTASHLIEALLYVMTKINMSPALMPIICFFICVVHSSATGSAASSVSASR